MRRTFSSKLLGMIGGWRVYAEWGKSYKPFFVNNAWTDFFEDKKTSWPENLALIWVALAVDSPIRDDLVVAVRKTTAWHASWGLPPLLTDFDSFRLVCYKLWDRKLTRAYYHHSAIFCNSPPQSLKLYFLASFHRLQSLGKFQNCGIFPNEDIADQNSDFRRIIPDPCISRRVGDFLWFTPWVLEAIFSRKLPPFAITW